MWAFLILAVVSAQIPSLIEFTSNNLLPEGVEYNSGFLVGSVSTGTINRVNNDGSLTLFSAQNVAALLFGSIGLQLDLTRNLLHIANGKFPPEPNVTGVQASYVAVNLSTGEIERSVDLTPYGPPDGTPRMANDLTIDSNGVVYLTDSTGSQIWAVMPDNSAETFVSSPMFDADPQVGIGLNGIEYNPYGDYLIVGKSGSMTTAALYKIDIATQGIGVVTISNGNVAGADGLYFDPTTYNILYVVGDGHAYKVQSTDDWNSATILQMIDAPQTCITPTTGVYVGSNLYVNCANQFGPGPYSIEQINFPSLPIPKSIAVNSPGLLPEGIEYDGISFLISSIAMGKISRVMNDGTLPIFAAANINEGLFQSLGLHVANGLLHVANARFPADASTSAIQSAYVAINLTTGSIVRWADLTPYGPPDTPRFANDLCVDSNGNAYVTDSMGSQIWMVNATTGMAESFVNSSLFDLDPDVGFGLNGIECHPDGFLLVGKMGTPSTAELFKVSMEDRSIHTITLSADISGADGVIFDPRTYDVLYIVGDGNVYVLETSNKWNTANRIESITVAETCITPTTATFVGDKLYVSCASGFSEGPYYVEEVPLSSSSSSTNFFETATFYYILGAIIVVIAVGLFLLYRRRKSSGPDIDMDTVDIRPTYARLGDKGKEKDKASGWLPS